MVPPALPTELFNFSACKTKANTHDSNVSVLLHACETKDNSLNSNESSLVHACRKFSNVDRSRSSSPSQRCTYTTMPRRHYSSFKDFFNKLKSLRKKKPDPLDASTTHAMKMRIVPGASGKTQLQVEPISFNDTKCSKPKCQPSGCGGGSTCLQESPDAKMICPDPPKSDDPMSMPYYFRKVCTKAVDGHGVEYEIRRVPLPTVKPRLCKPKCKSRTVRVGDASKKCVPFTKPEVKPCVNSTKPQPMRPGPMITIHDLCRPRPDLCKEPDPCARFTPPTPEICGPPVKKKSLCEVDLCKEDTCKKDPCEDPCGDDDICKDDPCKKDLCDTSCEKPKKKFVALGMEKPPCERPKRNSPCDKKPCPPPIQSCKPVKSCNPCKEGSKKKKSRDSYVPVGKSRSIPRDPSKKKTPCDPCDGQRGTCGSKKACSHEELPCEDRCKPKESCAMADPCPKPDPCGKKDPCLKRDPCAKADPCSKPDSCPKKDACAKADPCPKKDPCVKVEPCPKPAQCAQEGLRHKKDPCATADPCCKPDTCAQEVPYLKKDPCAKADLCPKTDSCAQEAPCPKKDPCAKTDPCRKPDPCAQEDPCLKKDPCAKTDACPKPDPCAEEAPCPRKDPCAMTDLCPKPDPCAKKDPCTKNDPCAKMDTCKKVPHSYLSETAKAFKPLKMCWKKEAAGTKTKPNLCKEEDCDPRESIKKEEKPCDPCHKADPCAPPDPCDSESKSDPCKSDSCAAGSKPDPCDAGSKPSTCPSKNPCTSVTSAKSPCDPCAKRDPCKPKKCDYHTHVRHLSLESHRTYYPINHELFPMSLITPQKDPGSEKSEHRDPVLRIEKKDPRSHESNKIDPISTEKVISDPVSKERGTVIAKKKKIGVDGAERKFPCPPCSKKDPCKKKAPEKKKDPCECKKPPPPQQQVAPCAKVKPPCKEKVDPCVTPGVKKAEPGGVGRNSCDPCAKEVPPSPCTKTGSCGKDQKIVCYRKGPSAKVCNTPGSQMGPPKPIPPDDCAPCKKYQVCDFPSDCVVKPSTCVAGKCSKKRSCGKLSTAPAPCVKKSPKAPPCPKCPQPEPARVGPCLEPNKEPSWEYRSSCTGSVCSQGPCKKKKPEPKCEIPPKPMPKEPKKADKCQSTVCVTKNNATLVDAFPEKKGGIDHSKHKEWTAVPIRSDIEKTKLGTRRSRSQPHMDPSRTASHQECNGEVAKRSPKGFLDGAKGLCKDIYDVMCPGRGKGGKKAAAGRGGESDDESVRSSVLGLIYGTSFSSNSIGRIPSRTQWRYVEAKCKSETDKMKTKARVKKDLDELAERMHDAHSKRPSK